MDLALRLALRTAIEQNPDASQVIRSLEMAADGSGFIEYEADNVHIEPSTPGFTNGRTGISDEEMVRAYLLVALITKYGYPATRETLDVERAYKPVGRPTGKGGRVDIVVRRPARPSGELGSAFLFIECKAPSKFDEDIKYIDGQLFRLSRQEDPRPRHLVYFTVELVAGSLRERLITVDTQTFSDFTSWDASGQPLTDSIPRRYGQVRKKRYGYVTETSERLRPLDRATSPETFSRLRTELHDVIWGGGGTNNNEVFVYITKLILAKIFDEKETAPGHEYRFQRLGDAVAPEPPSVLALRMNQLYREAEQAYLALTAPSEGPAFDASRISPEKLAFVVGRLEGISITENIHPGDLLGEFFEQIVAQDFTQTKGQFFTPVKIVRFMLGLCDAVGSAHVTMLHDRDHLGRPRLPYMIDPSCGAGTFLIEYMKQITDGIGGSETRRELAPRIREAHDTWFGASGASRNAWAKEYLFGVENNHDLGLASKVNMVLHGDGSMNTWIASGLAPFEAYLIDGRTNILGAANVPPDSTYDAPRNEQFDLIMSNPPFSIRLSPDERRQVSEGFCELSTRVSEALFLERWYQLLRDNGRFCCVLPEAILDTGTNASIRRFLLERFEIHAVVSLPYDAFRPFTSTKTAIVLAEKRTKDEIATLRSVLNDIDRDRPGLDDHVRFAEAFELLDWHTQPIFMAEPHSVGYKRRKNLSDLQQSNDLVDEADAGLPSVLGSWLEPSSDPDPRFGFRTTLGAVAARSGMRLDPKYRFLWDFQEGVALGRADRARPVGELLAIVKLEKASKGELPSEHALIDLETVESRQAFVSEPVPMVDEIGSDKICFSGAELAFSKLEPYLGKLIVEPPQGALGSTEWIGLVRRERQPLIVLAYLLLLPEMCEAYRRLQAGKRHARLVPEELLALRIEVPPDDEIDRLAALLVDRRAQIKDLRAAETTVRREIDSIFGAIRRP